MQACASSLDLQGMPKCQPCLLTMHHDMCVMKQRCFCQTCAYAYAQQQQQQQQQRWRQRQQQSRITALVKGAAGMWNMGATTGGESASCCVPTVDTHTLSA
jgi:hypothetical protein